MFALTESRCVTQCSFLLEVFVHPWNTPPLSAAHVSSFIKQHRWLPGPAGLGNCPRYAHLHAKAKWNSALFAMVNIHESQWGKNNCWVFFFFFLFFLFSLTESDSWKSLTCCPKLSECINTLMRVFIEVLRFIQRQTMTKCGVHQRQANHSQDLSSDSPANDRHK